MKITKQQKRNDTAGVKKPDMINVKTNDNIKARIRQKEEADISLHPSFVGCRMSIEITNACNHRCVFCPCRDLNRPRRFIDESLFYRLVDEGYSLGVRELAFHILGEPLLNKNLAKYIEYAKHTGYTYVYLTTNGALLTPERLHEIVDAGLDSIKFSINAGTPSGYLAVHGNDDFEQVRQNLIYCNAYRKNVGGKFNIFISCVVTNRTVSEIPKFKEIFSDCADDIAFYDILNRGGSISDDIRLNAAADVDEQENSSDLYFCQQPFNAICVTAEGILAPCCMDGDLHYNMADLHETALADALYSTEFSAFRKMHIEKRFSETFCEECLRSESQWIRVINL